MAALEQTPSWGRLVSPQLHLYFPSMERPVPGRHIMWLEGVDREEITLVITRDGRADYAYGSYGLQLCICPIGGGMAIRAFTNIGSLDWGTWFIGIMGAGISGAANGIVAMAIGVGWKKTAVLVGVSALVSLGKYLQQAPTPTPIQQKVETAQALASATKDAVDEVKASLPEPK
jgi:hypothetical protein